MPSNETDTTPPPAAEPVVIDPAAAAGAILQDAPKAEPVATPAPAPAVAVNREPEPLAAPNPGAERDGAGVVFDPEKHIRRRHPNSGRWMPKGGRKKRASTPAPVADGAGAWSDAERAAAKPQAPSPADSPAPAGSGAQPAAGDVPPSELVTNADDAAEVTVSGLCAVTGLLTGEPDEARMKGGDHANLSKTVATYYRSRGWHLTGGLALAVALLAYLIRTARQPKTEKKLGNWWTNWKANRAKRAVPEPTKNEPQRQAPAPASPPPAADPYAHLRH